LDSLTITIETLTEDLWVAFICRTIFALAGEPSGSVSDYV